MVGLDTEVATINKSLFTLLTYYILQRSNRTKQTSCANFLIKQDEARI